MAFSVVQNDLRPPTLDQLRAALAAALSSNSPYVPADAPGILRDSFGILMDNLTGEQADALRTALAGVGYPTTVVDHDELFSLPPSKGTNRLVPGEEALVVYDVLGRPSLVPWASVLVIAAGYVRKVRSQRSVEVVSYTAEGMPVEMVTIKELASTDPILELLLGIEPMRLRVDGRRFHYGYLAGRMTNNAEVNFLELVRDLVKAAPHAVINSGAESISRHSDDIAVYPLQRSFEEELVWQVWRSMRG